MNWDAIGAIGEILGAIAVLATLFYLARQINLSAIASTQSHLQMIQDSVDDWMMTLAKDPVLAEIHHRGLVQPESLSESEKRQFRWLIQTLFAKAEVVYFQFGSQTTSIRTSDNWFSILKEVLSTEGGSQCWNQISYAFEPSFVEYVDGIQAELRVSA